jgi:hypothetical protein
VDLFGIFNQELYLDAIIKHPRFLPDTVEKFIDAASNFKKEIFGIILGAKASMPVHSSNLETDFRRLAQSLESFKTKKYVEKSDYPEYKQHVIDFLMITNSDPEFTPIQGRTPRRLQTDRQIVGT